MVCSCQFLETLKAVPPPAEVWGKYTKSFQRGEEITGVVFKSKTDTFSKKLYCQDVRQGWVAGERRHKRHSFAAVQVSLFL